MYLPHFLPQSEAEVLKWGRFNMIFPTITHKIHFEVPIHFGLPSLVINFNNSFSITYIPFKFYLFKPFLFQPKTRFNYFVKSRWKDRQFRLKVKFVKFNNLFCSVFYFYTAICYQTLFDNDFTICKTNSWKSTIKFMFGW